MSKLAEEMATAIRELRNAQGTPAEDEAIAALERLCVLAREERGDEERMSVVEAIRIWRANAASR